MSDLEPTLLPCPFCGNARLENLDSARNGGSVMCIDCGARGPDLGRFLRSWEYLEGVVTDGFGTWNYRNGRAP